MKYLKTYEGIYSENLDKIKNEIIDKIISVMDKWNMPLLLIGQEIDGKIYGDIIKKKGEYIVSVEDDNDFIYKNLQELNASILNDICSEYIFSPEYHLEYLADNGHYDIILHIMEIEDKITFTKNIFIGFGEAEKYKDTTNKEEFQDLLFSKFPDAFKPFLKAIKHCEDNCESWGRDCGDIIKIHPNIKKKYSHLFDSEELGLL